MSDTVQGLVGRITTKVWGTKTFYTVKLNSDDRWFGLGTIKPIFKEGDKIEFEAKTNTKGFWEAMNSTLSVLSKGEENVSTGTTVTTIAHLGGNSKEGYWDRKEIRDNRQDELREIGATRNTAITFIQLLIANEAIKLPTKVADREGFLQKLLNDYIERFRAYGQDTDKVAKNGSALVETAVSVSETPDAWN